jgi:hypothetical protein
MATPDDTKIMKEVKDVLVGIKGSIDTLNNLVYKAFDKKPKRRVTRLSLYEDDDSDLFVENRLDTNNNFQEPSSMLSQSAQ